MNLALLLAFLTGHSFQTACVQTQVQSSDGSKSSGYVVDSVTFDKTSDRAEADLAVTFTRKFYEAADCKFPEADTKSETGTVHIGSKADSFFATNSGEERFEADWIMGSDSDKKELGSIGIDSKKSILRFARNTPGFARNTMLQLIVFKGTKLTK